MIYFWLWYQFLLEPCGSQTGYILCKWIELTFARLSTDRASIHVGWAMVVQIQLDVYCIYILYMYLLIQKLNDPYLIFTGFVEHWQNYLFYTLVYVMASLAGSSVAFLASATTHLYAIASLGCALFFVYEMVSR